MKIAEEIITIVCDDIRHEIGGKRSLIGIYDDIVVRETPQLLSKICLAVYLRKLKRTFNLARVTVINPTGDVLELPEIKIPPTIPKGSNYNLELFVVPFKIDQAGTYLWAIKLDNEKKPAITHKMIVRIAEKPIPSQT